jgi:hypothetical protein
MGESRIKMRENYSNCGQKEIGRMIGEVVRRCR